jgi:iron complex outermembrane receptor protein
VPSSNDFLITDRYKSFAEYEWHPTLKLTVNGGAKFSRCTLDFKRMSDSGGAVRTLPARQAAVYHYATFNTVLPSANVNFRFRENWSA